MTKKSKSIILGFLIIILLAVTLKISNSKTSDTLPISKRGFFLGTIIDINIYEQVSDDVFTDIFNLIDSIENKMSITIKNSEVSKINEMAGKSSVQVSPETFYVITKSKHYSSISDGLFDISIGPLVKLWGIGTENAKLPTPEEITSNLNKINYQNILLDKSNHEVKLLKEEMAIDLGSIAKGYVADEIAEYLQSQNIKNAIINLGGNIYALGNNPNSDFWSIGIQNPFEPRGKSLGYIHVKNKSIVTSGVYERYFEKDNKKYHHILDPFTGYPVENSLMSVSIISDNSIDADGLSTTVFSLGLEKGIELIESLDNVNAIFVTKDHNIYTTSNLKNHFTLTNNDFTLR